MSGQHRAASSRNVIAVIVIVVVVVLAFAGVKVLGATSNARVAVVHDGDGGVLELPLDKDTEQTVTTSLGSNTVVVNDGKVHVGEADCPNHDCIGQGSIGEVGEQIVCLPHKLWIEIVANASSDSVSDGGGFDVESR